MTSDDPQIRTLALTGLLDSANPRRKAKGMAGWIGQTESSPYLKQMSDLVNTPVTEQHSYQLPGEATGLNGPLPGMQTVKPTITQPPAGGPSAAMPTTSMVDQHVQAGPPPAPMSYTQPAATPFTTTRMRNVFLTGADKVKADKVAAAQGDIEGEKAGLVAAGFGSDQALEIIRRNKERQAGGGMAFQAEPLEVPDGKGGWAQTMGVFDKEHGQYIDQVTRQPLVGARPRQTTGSTSMGTKLEPLARIMFNGPFASLSQPQQQQVYQAMQAQANGLDTKGALAAVNNLIPNATVEQKMQLADALMSGTQTSPQPVSAGAGGSSAVPAVTPGAAGGPPAPTSLAAAPYGTRADGTPKGNGFFGALQRPDGNVSSELSMGTTDVTGQETEIPLLVPTLTAGEVQYLLSAPPGDWQNPTMKGIAAKAVDFARQRQAAGKPFFAQPGEENQNLFPQFKRGGPQGAGGPASTTPAAPPAAATGAPPKPGGLTGAIPPNFGAANKDTGKQLSPAIQSAVARTTQMNDIIDRALKALEPYKQSTSLDDTMKLVEHYRQGTEGDPFALAAAQLPDLAGLQQSASATLGGTSRSQRVYADKRQHVPRLPSGRQVMFAHNIPGLNADRVNSLSQVYEGDQGGFDSPATMYQKLVGLRDANTAFLADMTSAAQQQLNPIAPLPSHTATGGPPAPAGSGQPYLDPKTNQWIIP